MVHVHFRKYTPAPVWRMDCKGASLGAGRCVTIVDVAIMEE